VIFLRQWIRVSPTGVPYCELLGGHGPDD
jgi:hypothetical protein